MFTISFTEPARDVCGLESGGSEDLSKSCTKALVGHTEVLGGGFFNVTWWVISSQKRQDADAPEQLTKEQVVAQLLHLKRLCQENEKVGFLVEESLSS